MWCNSEYSIRKQGIVSMVRLIDHMIWQPAAANVTPANENNADATFDTIDDMSDGVAQDAARYVGESQITIHIS